MATPSINVNSSSLKLPINPAHSERREKMIRIAKTVFTVLLAISMALLQTPVTVIGFFCGIAFKPALNDAIQRIKELFQKQTAPTIAALVVTSIIAFPIVFLTVGFTTGAYIGIHFPFTEL